MGAKFAALGGYPLTFKAFDEIIAQRAGNFRRRSIGERGPVTFADVGVEGELRDDDRGSVDIA